MRDRTGTEPARDRSAAASAPQTTVIAFAGNPNVGKSTLFNALTGLHQHTGNWPGKTVGSARGRCRLTHSPCLLTDLPGTYSLSPHSAEEAAARDFLCFDAPDAVVIVCDATCLSRNLNLVLQTLELYPRAIVCVNLMDEARRKGIRVDLPLLSRRLGVPVVGTSARSRRSLLTLARTLDAAMEQSTAVPPSFLCPYPAPVEAALCALAPAIREACGTRLPVRWLGLQLLLGDSDFLSRLGAYLGADLSPGSPLRQKAAAAARSCSSTPQQLEEQVVSSLVHACETICSGVVTYESASYDRLDRRLDRILTSRLTGYPIMLALLGLLFWLTMVGANAPSALLASFFSRLQTRLSALFVLLHAPDWLHGLVVLGMYRVLTWVVSVMLPPMAIFFPLFTLLEDSGYLPRIAFNLDRPFQRCHACGKQALTMCMGFGCNAVGVTGCRIIDSPRERLLAILTNSLVPCNGRFPALLTLITLFFAGSSGSFQAQFRSAFLLTVLVAFSVACTLLVTRLLSATLLKGLPSAFALELPPYRRPRISQILVRSVLDRTAFVLGRAAAVAAPAGMLLWILANVPCGETSLLLRIAEALDAPAHWMGLDGAILTAFLCSFPANELLLPVLVMIYLAQGSLTDSVSLETMRALFAAHGWTAATAGSVVLFTLFHWPCSTTLLTIRRETGSRKWTVLAAVIPTALGVLLCMLFTACTRLAGG